MQLTPEQRAEIDRQKGEKPESRHLYFKATSGQAAQLQTQARKSESEKPQIEADYHKLVAASEEPGFSGWLRRRIRQDGRPIRKVAEAAAVELTELSAFRLGEGTLATDAVDRLMETLHLKLVEEPSS